MIYDPLSTYASEQLKQLTPIKLQELFNEAKVVSFHVSGIKLIKKVEKDITKMRCLLHGFDSAYNGEHR